MTKRAVLWGPAVAVMILLSPTACATTSAGSGGDRDVITREQLAEIPSYTAYDAVRQIRPTWLRRRGAATVSNAPAPVIVYIDRVRTGSIDELRNIRADDIQEIRYLDATDATMRFGTDHGGGAILVRTRRN